MARYLLSTVALVGVVYAQLPSSLTDLGGVLTSTSAAQSSLTDVGSAFTSTLAAQSTVVSGLTTSTTTGTASSTIAAGPIITVPAGQITAGISGSVISADPCSTTYAFSCTNAALCSDTTDTFTATYGPSSYNLRMATTTAGASGYLNVQCFISASSTATCAVLATFTSGKTTATAGSTIASSISYYTLPVQANYVAPTGTCASPVYSTLTGIGLAFTSASDAGPTAAPIYQAGIPLVAAAVVLVVL